MKLLADMGVSMTTVLALRRAEHDAVHLRDLNLITLPDPNIVELAVAQSRVILTFDLDFGALMAVTESISPSVILFRLRNQTPASVTPKLMAVLAECEEALTAGAAVVIDEDGYRIRRLPIQPLRRNQLR